MRISATVVAFLLASLTGSLAAKSIKAGLDDLNLHLFADDYEIASSTNLLRVLNKPKKHPEPVVVPNKPWEGDRAQAWGSVIQEPDGLLRLWYFAFNSERNCSPALNKEIRWFLVGLLRPAMRPIVAFKVFVASIFTGWLRSLVHHAH